MNLASYIDAGGLGSGRRPTLGSPQAKQAAWLDKRQTSIFGPKHVEEIQKNAKVKKGLKAFGTATGVKKEWDERGRGQMQSLRSLHDSIKQETAAHGYDAQYRAQRSRLSTLVQNATALDPKSGSLKQAQEHLNRAAAMAGKGDYRMATARQDIALSAVYGWLRQRGGSLQAAAGWVGFDFDGTLAEAEAGKFDPAKTGRPIRKMLDLLKAYLKRGTPVKIFSARVGHAEVGRKAVEDWCMKYVGHKLPITDKKDHLMTKLYDDKAVNPKDLSAYGTSEGVTKSWDIRGRSRKRVGDLLRQGGWKTKYTSAEWVQFHRMNQPGVLVVNRYFDRWQHKDDAGKRLASGDSLASLADYMEKLHGKSVQAYGTSEGLNKAWDTRGRGKKTMGEREQKVSAKKKIQLPSGATLYIGRPHAPQDRSLTPAKQQVYPVGKSGGYGGIKVSKGRLWPEQAYWKQGVPQAGVHPLTGKFEQANRQLNPKDYSIETRKGPGLGKQFTTTYAALDRAGDRGATIFVERGDADTGRVVEFNHDSAGRLQYGRKLLPSLGDTQVVRFNSERAQSTFLRQRYGIEGK